MLVPHFWGAVILRYTNNAIICHCGMSNISELRKYTQKIVYQKPETQNWGSKGKEFEQLIAGALDFANDLQFEGGGILSLRWDRVG